MTITLYCSFSRLVHGLADNRIQPSVLDDPNARFFFGCSPYLTRDPNFATSEGFGYVTESRRGAVEAAVALVVGCINGNADNIADRVVFAKTALGERRFDFQLIEDLERLLGWEPGTIEKACALYPDHDFQKIHTGDAVAHPSILQEVADRVATLGLGGKVMVL